MDHSNPQHGVNEPSPCDVFVGVYCVFLFKCGWGGVPGGFFRISELNSQPGPPYVLFGDPG